MPAGRKNRHEPRPMPSDSASQRYKFTFVVLLTVAALAGFVAIVQTFLIDILLAAIFAGMLHPFFKRTLKACKGRRTLAVSVVIGVTALAIALPFLGAMALVGSEALELSKGIVSWAREKMDQPYTLVRVVPDWLVPDEWLQTAISELRSRVGDVIHLVAGFLSRNVSSFTQGAIDLFLHLFVIFFGMFYFLQDAPRLVQGFIERVPLARQEARVLVDKTLLITSATLKSIMIVGVVQGALVGLAFYVTGLGQPWFWGAVVAVLSAIPALGSPIVYVPAALYLLVSGQTAAGIGLALWGAGVVGMVDNVLRLYIIGRGAALPDFLVFISTVGGLILLGAPGLLIGPVMVGLLLGILDLYQMVLISTGISAEAEPPGALAPRPARAEKEEARSA